MAHSEHQPDKLQWGMLVLLTGLTLIFSMIIVRTAPVDESPPDWNPQQPMQVPGPRVPAATEVSATISAGDIRVTRTMDALDFTINRGETIDDAVPAGPFVATFDATFEIRRPRTVRIGASHYGGLLMVRLGERLLFNEYAEPPADAGGEPRVTMSDYTDLHAGVHTVQYRFERERDDPAHLRALWQPIEQDAPAALPTDRG